MSSQTQSTSLRPFQRAIFGLYESVNRFGVLESRAGRALFNRAYFLYKRYYEDPFHLLVRNCPSLFRDATILDIGANIGYTALLFSRAAAASSDIIAFEPDAECLVSLRHNCSRDIAAGRITVVEAAVGDRNGEIEFWRNLANSSDNRTVTSAFKEHLRDLPEGDVQVRRVPLITVDSYLAGHPPRRPIRFIKLDVQGFEQQVLLGMKETVDRSTGLVVALEYGPDCALELGNDPRAPLEFFRSRGFQLKSLSRESGLRPLDLADLDRQVAKLGYIDIIAHTPGAL